jgi:hypothetical protein
MACPLQWVNEINCHLSTSKNDHLPQTLILNIARSLNGGPAPPPFVYQRVRLAKSGLERFSFYCGQNQSQSKEYKQSTRDSADHHGCARVSPQVPTDAGGEASDDQAPRGAGCNEGASEQKKWKNPILKRGINELREERKKEEDHVWVEEIRQHTLQINGPAI